MLQVRNGFWHAPYISVANVWQSDQQSLIHIEDNLFISLLRFPFMTFIHIKLSISRFRTTVSPSTATSGVTVATSKTAGKVSKESSTGTEMTNGTSQRLLDLETSTILIWWVNKRIVTQADLSIYRWSYFTNIYYQISSIDEIIFFCLHAVYYTRNFLNVKVQ